MSEDKGFKAQCCPIADVSIDLDVKQRKVFFWVLLCVFCVLFVLACFAKVFVLAVGVLVVLLLFVFVGWFALFRK